MDEVKEAVEEGLRNSEMGESADCGRRFPFTRAQLFELAEESGRLAFSPAVAPDWKAVYKNLAAAAEQVVGLMDSVHGQLALDQMAGKRPD